MGWSRVIFKSKETNYKVIRLPFKVNNEQAYCVVSTNNGATITRYGNQKQVDSILACVGRHAFSKWLDKTKQPDDV